MMTLADATVQLNELTQQLTSTTSGPAPAKGTTLIDQWMDSLREVEMTQPLADTLGMLRQQLGSAGTAQIQETILMLSQQISELSSKMGAEGEMPGLLDGLAAALRQIGDVSRTDEPAQE